MLHKTPRNTPRRSENLYFFLRAEIKYSNYCLPLRYDMVCMYMKSEDISDRIQYNYTK